MRNCSYWEETMKKNQFGCHSTTNEILEEADLTGKTVLITGGSSGLGKETARALASKGANVTIAAPGISKLEEAASEIEQLTDAKIEIGLLELDKPESIKAFVKAWSENHKKLDILVNNAGVLANKLMRTKDRWELQFAVNHLGHFLLTNLLLPALKEANNARVVNLSTSGHRVVPANLDDLNYENSEFDPVMAYSASKTAVLWFSNEFDRRHKSDGIRSYALHPGAVSGTGLLNQKTDEQKQASIEFFRKKGILVNVEQGAATSCWAATSEELEGKGGVYLQGCNIVTTLGDPNDPTDLHGYGPHSFDEVSEKRLWKISNELLNTNF